MVFNTLPFPKLTILQRTLESGRRRGQHRKRWTDTGKEWTSGPISAGIAYNGLPHLLERGCSSVDRASDRHAAEAGSIPRCDKGFPPPPLPTFSADSFTASVQPSCAIARINICAHVKDPVGHVRVRWIMETLKHPACTLGWVARLCRSWLSPGKAT